jgi:hypothetical protein
MLGLVFNPEDGDSIFLQNICKHLPDYTVSHPEDVVIAMRTSNLTRIL